MWWRDATIYQVYPRSFQDSDGDGVGDLEGIRGRLDHLCELGVDALWLSPIYPSPLADSGYDVADYTAVAPEYGTLADLDRLVEDVHARGLRLLLDLVPCHTSIEHPWFRSHPDRYVWADGRDGGPPNNWLATFGGPAWTRDRASGRWYLHTYYPEQPDLDWRNPDVPRAIGEAVRFWLDRGVDGFRADALQGLVKDAELRDDPPASSPFGLPLPEPYGELEHRHSSDRPEAAEAVERIRAAAGDALLVGEVYLPAPRLDRYLSQLDLAFAFELFHACFEDGELRRAIEAGAGLSGRGGGPGAAWVLSNHDFSRLPSRYGCEAVRAAAVLLLTLPGTAFVYQGDEIGMGDGPGAGPGGRRLDRAGRDAHRHPMQWDGSPSGGFSRGEPWLAPVDPAERNVADQRGRPGSLLGLYRDLIVLRRRLGEGFELLDAAPGVLAYRRGEHTVAINTTPGPLPAPPAGEPVLASADGALRGSQLAPHAAVVRRCG